MLSETPIIPPLEGEVNQKSSTARYEWLEDISMANSNITVGKYLACIHIDTVI